MKKTFHDPAIEFKKSLQYIEIVLKTKFKELSTTAVDKYIVDIKKINNQDQIDLLFEFLLKCTDITDFEEHMKKIEEK